MRKETEAKSTRIRIFLNQQLFLSGCGFRPHASGEFHSEALQGRKNKSSTNPITCGGVNLDTFESDDVEDSCPNSYRTKHQNGGATATEQIWRYYRGLYGACSEHILLQRSPGYLSESGYHRMRYRETKPTCCAPSDAILIYFLLKDWTRFCTSSDSKISGFTRPHVVGFVADSFFSTLESGFS